LKPEELEKAGCLSYGSNVKEVTTQISEGMVSAGIVYATDAVSAGLTAVDTATEKLCGKVVYPAALTGGSSSDSEARKFLDYLGSTEARTVFEKIGFTVLKQ
jgi:molybdate transport system substrate-binding protein